MRALVIESYACVAPALRGQLGFATDVYAPSAVGFRPTQHVASALKDGAYDLLWCEVPNARVSAQCPRALSAMLAWVSLASRSSVHGVLFRARWPPLGTGAAPPFPRPVSAPSVQPSVVPLGFEGQCADGGAQLRQLCGFNDGPGSGSCLSMRSAVRQARSRLVQLEAGPGFPDARVWSTCCGPCS